MKELAPGIVLFDNVFPDAMDYVNKINNEKVLWRQAEVLLDQGVNESGTNYKARDTDIILLPHHTDSGNSILNQFTRQFHENMTPFLEKYKELYAAQTNDFENPQLLRYKENQMFHDHIDDHPFFTRRISLTFYINDDYEGGDIEFSRFDLRIKAKANQMLMFPSNYVYNHRVYPVVSGTRYVVIQWMA